ncbi:hypothetical protein B0J14DRAFT_337972 [Halenospora varia]|nr:hypothetical protein B0J14DRAFT_337972 [Halenospora varia]
MQLILQKDFERRATGKLTSRIFCHGREIDRQKLLRFQRSHTDREANFPSYIRLTTPPLQSHLLSFPKIRSIEASALPQPVVGRHDNPLPFIGNLPRDVVCKVLLHFDLEDIFNFALTCRSYLGLVSDEKACKLFLETQLPFCKETQEAIAGKNSFAFALQRAAKRRLAFRTAHPFAAIVIGIGDSFTYQDGMLCYSIDGMVRVLNLYESDSRELVISTHVLLGVAIHEPIIPKEWHCQLLQCSPMGLLSFLFTKPTTHQDSWLVIFDLQKKAILVSERLPSTKKLFIRQNRQYICYGIQSDIETDGKMDWEIRIFSISKGMWYEDEIAFPDVSYAEIGTTTCFELHDGYFYAASNQTNFNFEETWSDYDTDWISYYHLMRFPLNAPCTALCETSKIWRRQHQEGPIDERWTMLKLEAEETTGKLRIIELRNEWLEGSSKTTRTSYMTDIIFPAFALSFNLSGGDELYCRDTGFALYRPWKRHSGRSLIRLPSEIHPCTSYPLRAMIKRNMFCVQYYHSASNTFLDMVDEPVFGDTKRKQRLRLRVDYRLRLPPNLSRFNSEQRSWSHDEVLCELKHTFKESDSCWPPEKDPQFNNHDDHLDRLDELLNPPNQTGEVRGVADERSVVYSSGSASHRSHGKHAAIVFISFDPAIRLTGIGKWVDRRSNQDSETQRSVNNSYTAKADEKKFQETESLCWEECAMFRRINRGYCF